MSQNEKKGRRREAPPDKADYQYQHQDNANTFMQFGRLMVPAIVIAERDHPQTQRKHAIDGNCDQPVQDNRNCAIAKWRITKLHNVNRKSVKVNLKWRQKNNIAT